MTKFPLFRLSINRYGFGVLDTTFTITGAEDLKSLVILLISQVTGRDPQDDNDFISSWYDETLSQYEVNPENGYQYFYIGDDLISFIRFDK
jgi:hypothetical protein